MHRQYRHPSCVSGVNLCHAMLNKDSKTMNRSVQVRQEWLEWCQVANRLRGMIEICAGHVWTLSPQRERWGKENSITTTKNTFSF